MDDLGERIRELRKKKGLTLHDVGEHFRISRSSVSDWEGGRTYPDPRKLVELSRLLNTSIEYLLTGRHEAAWPFPGISRQRILQLSESQLEDLSLAITAALTIIEARGGEGTSFPPRDGTGTHGRSGR